MVKIFVCIGHERLDGALYAICMKATSQTALYENNIEMRVGVVYYTAGDLGFFTENTAIQPDNLHPIPHAHLVACHSQGSLTIIGAMPIDFEALLIAAVNASVTLSTERKQNILRRI